VNAIRVATAASIQDTSDAGRQVADTDSAFVVFEVGDLTTEEEPENEKATPESTTP